MSKLTPPLHFRASTEELTQKRIEMILKYVIYCYQKMTVDGIVYDYSKKGKLKKESFLRNGLVDDYLSKNSNKEYYKNYISDNSNVEIFFAKEENEVYQINEILADDFIDISVKETEISEILGKKSNDEIKFAIECKRINKSNDYTEYVKDIQKFVSRPFQNYRLSIEGQIAFIENETLDHSKVSSEINKKLMDDRSISTSQTLAPKLLAKNFDASYISKHQRNYGNQEPFSIYHLLLKYSNLIN